LRKTGFSVLRRKDWYRKEAEQLVSQDVIPHKKYFGGSLPYDFFGKKIND